MFGHDDHKKDEDQYDDEAGNSHSEKVIAPVGDQASDSAGGNDWQHPGTPLKDDDKTDDFSVGSDDSAQDSSSGDTPSSPPATPFSTTADATHGPGTSSGAGDSKHDLIDIKQEALGKLSPLIGHLDQAPEEKFRTLMMMIQASDDQALVKQAYETALTIEDEKTRAQALLDIVNEINYFTQNPKSE